MRYIFFDIDNTLLVNLTYTSKEELEAFPKGSLTLSGNTIHAYKIAMLHKQAMSDLFKKLLASKNIEIGFLTGSMYDKSQVQLLLEKEYSLPVNSLGPSIYYNRNNFCGDAHFSKGRVMYYLLRENIITADSVLVDDSFDHINDAEALNFVAVYADTLRAIPRYIRDIDKIIKSLPLMDKTSELDMASFRRHCSKALPRLRTIARSIESPDSHLEESSAKCVLSTKSVLH